MVPRPGRNLHTGHGASEEEEAYGAQLAGPDVVPPRTAMDFDLRRSPPGRKSVKTEDQKPLRAKETSRREISKTARRKKKMRAPGSAEEPPSSKPRKKDPPREYAPEELDRIVSRVELAQHLERNPVLTFLQSELRNEHTGPVAVPDVKSLTKMRHVVSAMFTLLRDAGYALGSFELERILDWDVEAWKQAITGMVDPLDVLAGVVEQESKPAASPKWTQKAETVPVPAERESPRAAGTPGSPSVTSPLFESSSDSDSRTPMKHAATAATIPTRSASQDTPEPAISDESMALVSSLSSTHDHRGLDEDPGDRFDLEPNTAVQAATIATAIWNARAWPNRVKSAARRGSMTGEEICALFGEEEILGALAASITPRAYTDVALEDIAPPKRLSRTTAIPVTIIGADESLHVVSSNGSAKSKRKEGAFSLIVWKLPGWDIARAKSGYAPDLTVNEVEHQGMLLGCSMWGELEWKSRGLRLLSQRAHRDLKAWPNHDYFHVWRDWNASADMLAGQALQRQGGVEVRGLRELQDLVTLNRLDEVMRQASPDRDSPIHDPDRKTGSLSREVENPTGERNDVAHVQAVVTRSTTRQQATPRSRTPELHTRASSPPQERIVQQIRLERIRIAQDEEGWMGNLKKFLVGDRDALSRRDARNCSKLADRHEVGEDNLLLSARTSYTITTRAWKADIKGWAGLTIGYGAIFIGQESLPEYNASSENMQVARLARDARQYAVSHPVVLWPLIRSKVVATDHIPSLPVSYKGNTGLLVWVDLFFGFVVVKANASRTAQTVAEAYEEAVFRRFGAREVIRHDLEPGFMSDFFKAFNKLLGQRQRATLAYQPQANGAAKSMVQTITRAIKMYIMDVDQRDWNEYAERLTFALNTAHDRTRNKIPFYLVHRWDPKTTLESTPAVGNMARQDVAYPAALQSGTSTSVRADPGRS
ncbi:unnamed protein product [Phytophthora fragariaefolia]|uniref:Unnamed protein product n=1 Tax=Phytophthora fragariaefolia TaxID=1490495 RepID=A0A9W6TL80_9STRA|nr:unnamed protein product [Phytophthora fragariaefolia]